MNAQVECSRLGLGHKVLSRFRRPLRLRESAPGTAVKGSPLAWHAVPCFDRDEEFLFWQERKEEALKPLRMALLLGTLSFSAFILLDVSVRGISLPEVLGRLMVVCFLSGVYGWLRWKSPARSVAAIALLSSLAAAAAAMDLIATLLIYANPAVYPEIWPAFLPIYFVTYGQLVMPIRETLLFGMLSLIAVPLSGFAVGVDGDTLLSSGLMLLIVNLFGLYTRCQLEAYSRKSFRERRRAEAAAEEKAAFMRQASHNLRQPLQALSCYTSVLEDGLAHIRLGESRRTLAKLGAAIDELADSFNRILDITNLETGKQIPHIADVELNALLAGLEIQFAPQAAKKGLRLKVLPRTKPPYAVRSDANMLRQILGNLIDNAIKYTDTGWVLVAATPRGAPDLVIHVRDTGTGIPDDQSEAIFKEFYRCRRRQADSHAHGLGIGLAYAMKAVERLESHGLRFVPKPGRGSDFQLSVPVSIAALLPKEHPAPLERLVGRFVLVVDDDEEVLSALARQLQCWGCLVETAGSIAQLRRVLNDCLRRPDLLITDYFLGARETAQDVIALVSEEMGTVPTLILSARGIQEAEKARWPQVTQILRKPAGAGALAAAMGHSLGLRTPREAEEAA